MRSQWSTSLLQIEKPQCKASLSPSSGAASVQVTVPLSFWQGSASIRTQQQPASLLQAGQCSIDSLSSLDYAKGFGGGGGGNNNFCSLECFYLGPLNNR